MKTQILYIALILMSCIYKADAQEPRTKAERIKAVKVAFIIEEINLTPDQSQNFWPVYNELESKIKAINKSNKKRLNIDEMSDSELETMLNNRLKTEEEKLALHRAYIQKFKKVITIRQIVLLQRAEKRFKKELLRRARERKEGRGGDNSRRRGSQ
jgi:hypothetical protein